MPLGSFPGLVTKYRLHLHTYPSPPPCKLFYFCFPLTNLCLEFLFHFAPHWVRSCKFFYWICSRVMGV